VYILRCKEKVEGMRLCFLSALSPHLFPSQPSTQLLVDLWMSDVRRACVYLIIPVQELCQEVHQHIVCVALSLLPCFLFP
jgi:hypothetical protein